MNERNTLLYKNIISHTLLSKGWCLLCVRDELETGIDCYIDPKFFFDHSNTSSSSWLGLLNRGSLRAQRSKSVCWFSRGHLVSNWLEPPQAPGYIIVKHPPASAVLPLIYTGASPYWRLGRVSIYNKNT